MISSRSWTSSRSDRLGIVIIISIICIINPVVNAPEVLGWWQALLLLFGGLLLYTLIRLMVVLVSDVFDSSVAIMVTSVRANLGVVAMGFKCTKSLSFMLFLKSLFVLLLKL